MVPSVQKSAFMHALSPDFFRTKAALAFKVLDGQSGYAGLDTHAQFGYSLDNSDRAYMRSAWIRIFQRAGIPCFEFSHVSVTSLLRQLSFSR